MNERERWYVESDQNHTGWQVRRPNGSIVPLFTMKEDAIQYAAREAAARWEDDTVPTQLMIRRADGTFEDERTYGLDPHPPEG